CVSFAERDGLGQAANAQVGIAREPILGGDADRKRGALRSWRQDPCRSRDQRSLLRLGERRQQQGAKKQSADQLRQEPAACPPPARTLAFAASRAAAAKAQFARALAQGTAPSAPLPQFLLRRHSRNCWKSSLSERAPISVMPRRFK